MHPLYHSILYHSITSQTTFSIICSTDGTEPSYKHYREEPSVCGTERGYEMWLLSEASKRNPDVQSFILSWGVPNWVGNGSFFSEENIEYQVGYAKCVRETIGGNHPHYGTSCSRPPYLFKCLIYSNGTNRRFFLFIVTNSGNMEREKLGKCRIRRLSSQCPRCCRPFINSYCHS